jgi:hypothetical protein
MSESLQTYHDCFCKCTGHELNFQVQSRRWFEFQKAGYTVEDLRITLEHLKASNRKNDFKYSLKIHNVIGDLEKFDSICGEAKAIERNRRPKPTNREAVLQSFSPTIGETKGSGNMRHVNEIFVKPPMN